VPADFTAGKWLRGFGHPSWNALVRSRPPERDVPRAAVDRFFFFGGCGAAALVVGTGTIAGLLAWPDRRDVVLVEVTPSLTLEGFAAAAAPYTPSVYTISIPRLLTVAGVTGGLYRRVVGVRENATDLTQRSSPGEVTSFASSWYWDEAAGVLYVRSSTGASPDTFTAYQAFVTYYFATEGRVLNRDDSDPNTGIYYHPWVEGDLPRLSRQVSGIIFGLTLAESGTVTFTNAGHGAFHTLIPGHNWRNKKVRFFLGGDYLDQVMPRSAYSPIATMLVADIAADEESATCQLIPFPKLLERELPPTAYAAGSLLGEGVAGTRKWIGYGRAKIAPDLTNNSSHGVWTVADAAYQTLFAVHAVWAVPKGTGERVQLASGTDYSVNLSACTITVLNATYKWQDYSIECDVTGKPDGAGSYLKTFGQIVKDMLQAFLGVGSADLDLPAFTQADVDAQEELAVWLKEPQPMAAIISSSEAGRPSLERSVLGSLLQTLDGKWTVRIWNGTAPAPTAVSLRKEDFARFQPQPKIESVLSRTRVHYAFDAGKGEWAVAEAQDLRAEYFSETKDELDVWTFLVSSSDAIPIAQRFQLLAGAQSIEYSFEERAAKLALEVPGTFVIVTYDPAPVAGGKLVAQPLELLELNVALAPTLALSGRLGDLRNVADRVGHWAPDGAPAWSSATEAEKLAYGFWSDDAGLIDPLDPETKNQSIWW
jgi:hypothetical protein